MNTTEDTKSICPKHPNIELWGVLKGGAGWCSSCFLFVQSANHIEPLRDIPRPEPKKAKRKAKATPAQIAAVPLAPAKETRRARLIKKVPTRIIAA